MTGKSLATIAAAERALSPSVALTHTLWLRKMGWAPYFEATFESVSKPSSEVKKLIWC